MKKIILAIVLVTAVLFSSAFANTPIGINHENSLRTEVMKFLSINELETKNLEDQEIQISFIITAANQIVVTSVDTDSAFLDDYCKNHLNYKTIKTAGIDKTETYHVNLKFK